MGSDKVSALFLKKCAKALCIPIAQLFNKSVSLGEYPTMFKYNLILPVHKKDDRSNIANYRPISIEPILAKIFERFVNNSLRQQLTNYMCFEQHGFLPGRSTISNLACYADEVSRCLDEKTEMHSIYTDFSRAFDSVCHDFLIAKLEYHYGIHGVSLNWFRSYLSGRYQRVVVHGVESTWTKVTSGVVQGSVLGPTMFNLFINDLPLAIKSSRCSLFADDAKISKQIKRLPDCYELQSDIDNLKKKKKKWYITINLTKCKYISFSLLKSRSIEYTYHFGAHIIEQVNEIKDLGVIFSKNLNFSTHINYIIKKSFRMLGFIKRSTKPINNVKVLINLYYTLVRSNLEYCNFIWSPSATYLVTKLERVQRKFTRFLCFKQKLNYKKISYENRCKLFNLQTLEERRKISDIIYINKIITGKVDCPPLLSLLDFNSPLHRTRVTVQNTFRCKSRINARKNSPIQRAMELVNRTGVDVFNPSQRMLKQSLQNFFD